MTPIDMPSDPAGWVRFFQAAPIPVFRRTIAAIEALRADEDTVSPSRIAGAVQADPLMTLKVLAFAARQRSARVVTDSETVTSALVLMGISPFFREFGEQVAVEDVLASDPDAQLGLAEVVERAFRAAHFAAGFAIERADADAEVIQQAALLHEFAEMLLWCRAPAIAGEIRRRQLSDPSLRSAPIQRELLGTELPEIEAALLGEWRLPALLREITDHNVSHNPRARNVLLAVRLARHTQRGWDNPALSDDFRDIGELLHTSPRYARRKAYEMDR